ncbi:MAG: hypothetical protein GXP62_04960 [Oligoflexia bacterium]|nr:hypothetical protein [Oligoflexia bacterium]
MLHDRTAGRVSAYGELGHTIRYWPDAADRAELVLGLVACARLLFAAGAQQVVIPTDPVMKLAPGDSLDALAALELRRGLLDITAVHPMASVPMGDDPAVAAVNSMGAHHHVQGLWVSDGSLFPTSIGVPPQLSIYSLAHHIGRAIALS